MFAKREYGNFIKRRRNSIFITFPPTRIVTRILQSFSAPRYSASTALLGSARLTGREVPLTPLQFSHHTEGVRKRHIIYKENIVTL